MNSIAKFAILFSTVFFVAFQPAPAPTYTGCVMTSEAGDITFCEPDNCSVLTGKDVSPKLYGHSVTVRASVLAATPSAPRTLIVSSVVSIGAACNQSCSPKPPGHRGIGGGHERPGSEGGTPGVMPQQVPQ